MQIPTLLYDGTHPITLEATITPFASGDRGGVFLGNTEGAGTDIGMNEFGFPRFLVHDGMTRY